MHDDARPSPYEKGTETTQIATARGIEKYDARPSPTRRGLKHDDPQG